LAVILGRVEAWVLTRVIIVFGVAKKGRGPIIQSGALFFQGLWRFMERLRIKNYLQRKIINLSGKFIK